MRIEAGKPKPLDAPGLRKERARILGVEAHLDGVALRRRVTDRRRLTGGDRELLLDEVDARHELGDRVLDLDAAVQLEEPEVLAVEHELGRACAPVADRAGEAHGRLAIRARSAGVEGRRRRLLEHLLVAALDRALALPERDDLAGPSASSWISTWRGRST